MHVQRQKARSEEDFHREGRVRVQDRVGGVHGAVSSEPSTHRRIYQVLRVEGRLEFRAGVHAAWIAPPHDK